MAWIEGTESQCFQVSASPTEVADYFSDPERFAAAFSQLEHKEKLADGSWRWTLVGKSEKGITFQGVYTVQYQRTADGATWETTDGNMRSTGVVVCAPSKDGTEVTYTEVLAVDLPIPKLAAKIFRPIVAREIRAGVGDFLDRSRLILGTPE